MTYTKRQKKRLSTSWRETITTNKRTQFWKSPDTFASQYEAENKEETKKMNTLKQILKNYGYNNDPTLIQMLKEWLTQKRQEYINTPPYENTKHGYGQCLDELLEDLEK